MSDKSYVTMEQHACLVCGKPFDTGALLLDRRVRPIFDRHTVTGWDLCPEHKKLHDEGYIALVGIDPAKSDGANHNSVKPGDAWRTGEIAHLRRSVFPNIFSVPLPDGPMIFVDSGVIERLKAIPVADASPP